MDCNWIKYSLKECLDYCKMSSGPNNLYNHLSIKYFKVTKLCLKSVQLLKNRPLLLVYNNKIRNFLKDGKLLQMPFYKRSKIYYFYYLRRLDLALEDIFEDWPDFVWNGVTDTRLTQKGGMICIKKKKKPKPTTHFCNWFVTLDTLS